MIAHIHGKLIEKTPTDVVIDCNGVGYHINISLHTYSLLPATETIRLFTYLQIKNQYNICILKQLTLMPFNSNV